MNVLKNLSAGALSCRVRESDTLQFDRGYRRSDRPATRHMLTERMKSIYAALSCGPAPRELPHSVPYVGGSFERPARDAMRVVVVGVNSYVSEGDVTPDGDPPMQEWLAGWAADATLPFFRTTRADCDELAAGLIKIPATEFEGLHFDRFAGRYVTNAVKRFVPKARGRYAADVDEELLSEGSAVWRDELRALEDHGALPHVIAVFGQRAWGPTCNVLGALCSDPHASAFVAYEPLPQQSDLFHRMNVVTLRERGTLRRCLVVRLDHPAARRRRGAAWIVAHPEFRRVLGGG